MFNTTTFGPDGQVVEQTIDHGDGTGLRTLYDADGQVTGTEALTGLPIPDPPAADPPAADPAAVLATVGASLAAIPANATSTQMRSTLRTLGEQITAAIPT